MITKDSPFTKDFPRISGKSFVIMVRVAPAVLSVRVRPGGKRKMRVIQRAVK
jgi:hypothetical protein